MMNPRPFLLVVLVVLAGFSFSLFAKNKPAYNRAFNNCTKKMEDAYAECLNMPYNSVAMCQNVANGVYKRCMRSAGFYTRDEDVPTPTNKPPDVNTGKSSPSPTPKPKFSPRRTIDGTVSTTTRSRSSPSPTPHASPSPRKHKGR
jgi:hypothetical protein